jgi:hypothetical protein
MWLKFCNLTEGLDVVDNIKLCTNHFRDEDYIGLPDSNLQRKRLRSGALPSIKKTMHQPTKQCLKIEASSGTQDLYRHDAMIEKNATVDSVKSCEPITHAELIFFCSS